MLVGTLNTHGCDLRNGNLHRRLGFTEEGRLRETVFTRGTWHDERVFGMTAAECAARHGGAAD